MATSPLKTRPADTRAKLKREDEPSSWVAPMLAVLTDKPFSRDGWIFERKFDGERCLIFREGAQVRLVSRNKLPLNGTYPELVEAFAAQQADAFIADGEIVAFEGTRTSFKRLQGRMGISDPERARRTGIAVRCYLFDLLYLDGSMTTRLPLLDRKALLQRTFAFRDPIRYTSHRARNGEAFLVEACRKGWEGLIAKDADAPYVHKRSRLWLKLKCSNRQEFVIGGFTDPQRSRIGFGALLIGYYEGKKLKFAGKVGTGFDDAMLHDMHRDLVALERDDSPFVDGVPRDRSIHWVKPKLVGEIGFTEWTPDGKLRHPTFEGLRRDKPAKDVRRET